MKMLMLDTKAEGFSVRNAQVLAAFAELAYREHTFRHGATGTEVLVEYLPEAIVIAFPGTSELRDWIVDAQFLRTEVHCGEVHMGFWKAWLGVKQFLREVPRLASRPVFFTGHSLGGALAQIAAKYFAVQGVLIGGVYTFGSPRVWDGLAAASYNNYLRAATFNLVNACDPVPLLPPLLAGYRDAGTEIFLPAPRGYVVDPFIGWEFIHDLMGAFRSWRAGSLAFLPNHFLTAYAEKLNAL